MNLRRRLHFDCPVCRHKSDYVRQTKYGFVQSEFRCENCNAAIAARRGLLLDALIGVLLGLAVGAVAYIVFVVFLSGYSPVLSIVIAGALIAVATYFVFGPMYAKWTLRWVPLERTKT